MALEVQETTASSNETEVKKPPKYGIIYLSTIPPYMNVTKLKEYFNGFGKVGRVYLQLQKAVLRGDKSKKYKARQRFSEGWIEFERKSVAKRVAQLLNNTQVDTRKKSKQYDSIWNIKYLSNFKWTHLTARLLYEKAAVQKKLREAAQKSKKDVSQFSSNIDLKNKGRHKCTTVNKEWEDAVQETDVEVAKSSSVNMVQFLEKLIT